MDGGGLLVDTLLEEPVDLLIPDTDKNESEVSSINGVANKEAKSTKKKKYNQACYSRL